VDLRNNIPFQSLTIFCEEAKKNDTHCCKLVHIFKEIIPEKGVRLTANVEKKRKKVF
jgi:hypothetical protein